jgi:hypothetical protein
MNAIHRWLAVAVPALGALLLVAAPAGAVELSGQLREFGTLTYPTGLAVDEVTGDVYVADGNGAEAVDVFGPEANGPSAVPLAVLKGTGSETFSFGKEPVGMAVDNALSSASYHDVYVADVGHNVVDKFKLNGPGEYEFACQIAGWYGSGAEACKPAGGSPSQPFVEPVGVTVDANGNVFISSYGPGNGFIAEFDAAGSGLMELNSSEHSGLSGHPAGLAASPEDLFVQNFESGREVVKFTLASPGAGAPITGPATAIAIDSASSDLYVDNGNYAEVFDPLGVLVESFTSSPFDLSGASRGIAARGSTHEIYGSSGSAGSVKVLGLIELPDVTSCSATEVTPTSARLNGQVNALEAAGAQYHFDYGPSAGYGLETLPTGITGNALTPVSATVTELLPGTTYHCRLAATDTAGLNAGGLFNRGSDATFTTPSPRPEVSPEALVSDVTADSVLFHGSIKPNNGDTSYHFEYGRTTSYETALPDVGIGVGFAPISVEQASEAPLAPGTTYHYALVARNPAGETTGEDHTFTTLSAPATPLPPVVGSSGAIAVSATASTLAGIVDPKLLRTTCRFKLGTTASYGTEAFSSLGPGASVSVVSASFQNLAPGAVYHFRLVAANAGGVSEGPDQTFVTPGLPVALASPAAPLLIPTLPFPSFKEAPTKHKPKKKHKKPKKPVKKGARPGGVRRS